MKIQGKTHTEESKVGLRMDARLLRDHVRGMHAVVLSCTSPNVRGVRSNVDFKNNVRLSNIVYRCRLTDVEVSTHHQPNQDNWKKPPLIRLHDGRRRRRLILEHKLQLLVLRRDDYKRNISTTRVNSSGHSSEGDSPK